MYDTFDISHYIPDYIYCQVLLQIFFVFSFLYIYVMLYIKKGWYIMQIDIKQKLKESGMTRYELAKRIGVTYPTIDNIYKGTSTSIKFEILEAICKELNCSPIDILISDDQQMKRLLAYASKINELNKNKSDT